MLISYVKLDHALYSISYGGHFFAIYKTIVIIVEVIII